MHCLLSSFLPTYGMFIMCYFLYSSLCSDHPTLYLVSSPLDLSPSFIHFSYYVHHSRGRTRNASYPSLDPISEQIVLYGQLLLKISTINDSKPRSFQSNQDTKCPLVSSLWIGPKGMWTQHHARSAPRFLYSTRIAIIAGPSRSACDTRPTR